MIEFVVLAAFFAGVMFGAGGVVLIAMVMAAGSRSDAKWR